MLMFQLYHPYFDSWLPKTLSEQHVKEKNNFLNTGLALEYSALCKGHTNVSEYMGCIIICPILNVLLAETITRTQKKETSCSHWTPSLSVEIWERNSVLKKSG